MINYVIRPLLALRAHLYTKRVSIINPDKTPNLSLFQVSFVHNLFIFATSVHIKVRYEYVQYSRYACAEHSLVLPGIGHNQPFNSFQYC